MFQDKKEEKMESVEETARAPETGAEERPGEPGAGQEENAQAERNIVEENGAEGSDANAADETKEAASEEDGQEKKESAKKDPRDEKIGELQDRLKRQMAEFDNFRKRTEKEKSAMYEIGARDIIEKILPVLDNFERGLAAVPEDGKADSFAEGVTMIYKQFVKTLEDAGVEAIEAKGQKFDPNLHNAVMHIEDENFGENEISQELQKGYKYRGTVIRHSMVQVAN